MTATSSIDEQNSEWYGTRRYELFTVTIAAPGVVKKDDHGLLLNDRIKLFTSGALPTGLAVDTWYYVIPSTAHTFQLSATRDGVAITTSGSQSGSHHYAGERNRMTPAYENNR